MHRRLSLLFCSLLACFTCSIAQSDYSAYVNPMIGTGGHGHTFPGAVRPFSMMQLSPDTRVDGSWDGCSGYHYNDSIIYGFSHTHLSGTGCSDYGDIMLMPTLQNSTDPKNYSSGFSHKNEKAEAGFYSVILDKGVIKTEFTVSKRGGMHHYNSDKAMNVVLDLLHRDQLLEGDIEIVNDSTIKGHRFSKAWAQDQRLYYFIRFSKPFKRHELSIQHIDDASGGKKGKDQHQKAIFFFDTKDLLVKVGISAVSAHNARLNIDTEIPHWNFEKVRKEARDDWNKELSKIAVSDHSNLKKKIFYTALYHCMIHPSLYSDVNGEYRGRDMKVHKAEHDYYTVFSLWDTFRALHPLLTLIDQKRTADFINTFILQYEQGGRLPVWELSSNETECMIGYHAVSVIADAMLKGIKGFDYEKAYQACRHSAMLDHFGLKAYKEKGYIEIEDESESVSRTLEYSYDDWCIAQMAELLGKKEDEELFSQRGNNYKNVFDTSTGHMRPRSNGGWLSPFEPREVNNYFTEGNSWQYTFFVLQNPYSLWSLYQGALDRKLDALFTANAKTTGREQADITGLIGQYAHGNEPSHHMAYLYNCAGKPWKTQEKVRYILDNFYKNDPDGLIGNEDCGQMSAWYVLSSLGLYQLCPGNPQFTLSSPYISKAVLNFENGNCLGIEANGMSHKKYIQKAVFGNREIAFHISYNDLMSKKYETLSYTLSSDSLASGSSGPNCSIIGSYSIPGALIIQSGKQVFKDQQKVEIIYSDTTSDIRYTLDGTEAGINSLRYKEPFTINSNVVIHACAISKGEIVSKSTAHYYKKPNDWSLKIAGEYNPQYSAGGDEGLIDGLQGDNNWRKGRWQGYQDQDFEVIVDMKKVKEFTTVGASFLQDAGSWIMMPVNVTFEISDDAKNFKQVALLPNKVADTDIKTQTAKFSYTFKNAEKARYFRVKAKNYGVLPKWHPGAGYPAFIFVDEVWVK